MNYNNFDLRLTEDPAGIIRVETIDGGQKSEFQEDSLPTGAWDAFKSPTVDGSKAAALGNDLFYVLFHQAFAETRKKYDRLRTDAELGQAAGTRLRLLLEGKKVNSLPWELLRYAGIYLATDYRHMITRFINFPESNPSPLAQPHEKLNILHILLNGEVGWFEKQETEATLLHDYLRDVPAETDFAFTIEQFRVSSRQQLDNLLLDRKDNQILFLRGDCQSGSKGATFQLAGDKTQYSFQRLFFRLKNARGNKLPVVIIGVPGEVQGNDLINLSSFAKALVSLGVPATVIVPTALDSQTSASFLGAFYNALAAGLPVDHAVVAGRAKTAIKQSAVTGPLAWSGFILYSCLKDGLIFEVVEDEEEETARLSVPATPPSGALQSPSVPQGQTTIINSQQMQFGEGGIQLMGTGQQAIGLMNIQIGTGKVAASQQAVKVDININLGLEAAAEQGDETRLKVSLDVKTRPPMINYAGEEHTTPIQIKELVDWTQTLFKHRWALKSGEQLWSMIEPDVVEQGQRFFEQLFHQSVEGRKKLDDALMIRNFYPAEYRMGLRLRHELLQSVPWELLHDGQAGFICLAYPLYRLLDQDVVIPLGKFHKKIERVLIVAADPKEDLGEVDNEAIAVAEILCQKGFKEKNITIVKSSEASKQHVENALSQGNFQLFHFAGHGQYEDFAPGQSSLWLGKPGGEVEAMKAEFLQGILGETALSLVFLSACTTAQHQQTLESLSQDQPWKIRGLAQAFARGLTPAVIAMHWVIADEAGKALAKEFYGRLRDYPIPEALRRARLATKEELAMDWANPVLAMRDLADV